MVPFVEVILLTAMEYFREDKEKGKKRKNKRRRKKQKKVSASLTVVTVKPMENHTKDTTGETAEVSIKAFKTAMSDGEDETDILTGTHWCRGRSLKQWLPKLKTIGTSASLIYHFPFTFSVKICKDFTFPIFQRGESCLPLCL